AHRNLHSLHARIAQKLEALADGQTDEAQVQTLRDQAGEHLALAEEHQGLHERYKPDDNAQGRAVRLAREKYPAANHAAEAVVKYPLQREGAPGRNGPAPEKITATSASLSE